VTRPVHVPQLPQLKLKSASVEFSRRSGWRTKDLKYDRIRIHPVPRNFRLRQNRKHRKAISIVVPVCLLVLSLGCGPGRNEATKKGDADAVGAKPPEKQSAEPTPKQETKLAVADDVAVAVNPAVPAGPDRKLIEELYRTKETSTFLELLSQNKPGADLDRLDLISQLPGPVEEIKKIPRKEGAYYIVIASRTHPRHIRGASALPQVAIAFDETGRILATMGGEVSTDGSSGDSVELLDLGSKNSWFVLVSRFERHGIFPEQSDVYIVRDQFPRAIRAYEFKLAYSAKFEGAALHGQPFIAFIKKADVIPSEMGIGRDGKNYPLPIYWDVTKGKFRGPSHIKLHDVDYFDIVIAESHAFEPIDVPEPDQ
jgi:hypothetical protein